MWAGWQVCNGALLPPPPPLQQREARDRPHPHLTCDIQVVPHLKGVATNTSSARGLKSLPASPREWGGGEECEGEARVTTLLHLHLLHLLHHCYCFARISGCRQDSP